MAAAPKPPNFYADDFKRQGFNYYSTGHYHLRNLVFAEMIARHNPRSVYEIAGAEGDLAQVLLEHYTSIQRYAWTDFCPDAVDYVTNRLRHIRDRQLSISRVDAENVSELHFDGADMIVCTALEHLAHDQEIIKAIPQGTKVALCLPSLMWDSHLRCFQNWDAITQRYPSLHIRDYVTMGFAKNDYNKKYLLVATKT